MLDIKQHVFMTPHDLTLKMAANRYRTSLFSEEAHGLTLLLTHCIGSHKEQWEPVIERVFWLRRAKERSLRIREVWAFDWQSHGDSAVLNHQALDDRSNCVSAAVWTLALTAFIRSTHVKGHRIIAMGHSAGSAAVMLTTKGIPFNEQPYRAIILIEPTIVTREVFNSHLEDRMAAIDFSVAATSMRRNIWKSRAEAFEYFKKRVPWDHWDLRVVRILTEHGLQELPSGEVTLKCDRRLEAASYPDIEPHFDAAVQLERICRLVPIHVVWGTRNDLVPQYIQEFLSENSEGRVATTRIEGAGHLIVQEKPDQLAQAISNILDTINTDGVTQKSKL